MNWIALNIICVFGISEAAHIITMQACFLLLSNATHCILNLFALSGPAVFAHLETSVCTDM